MNSPELDESTSDRPMWEWDEATWRGLVDRAGVGRRLTVPHWPEGARAAVALSFDSDHETLPMNIGHGISPGRLSEGTYGSRAAVPRILDFLSTRDIPVTFFMPAVSALLHPDEVRSYAEQGHEVGLHGWIHESTLELTPDRERELTLRAADTLEHLTGRRPVGLRTPSWDFSPATLGIIRELGLRYDSSLMADDEPYELLDNGEPTGIVELPVDWIRDDAPFFMVDWQVGMRPMPTVGYVISMWRSEFQAAYDSGGVFQLTMHPHIIGHRSRLRQLFDFIDDIASRDDVWFARHDQVAQHVRDLTMSAPRAAGS